jgi:hypothetical protein
MIDSLIFVLGWAGGLLVVFAYWAACRRPSFAAGARYQRWNLVGSLGLASNALWHGAIPSTVMNLLWSWIALAALARLQTRRTATDAERTVE